MPPVGADRQTSYRSRLPGAAYVVALAAVAWSVASLSDALSSLVVGVALGALAANIAPVPESFAPGITWVAKSVLRAGVVLLGLRLSLGDVVDLGARGLLVVATVVLATFFGTQLIAQRLGLRRDLGLLIATGYSICGASAIAAVNGTVGADDDETAYAITLVTLYGSLSILALPLIGSLIGFDDQTFGTWVGASVHDVGQVVAAASTRGDSAVEAATVVKLTRVVLLAPLVALVAANRRRLEPADDAGTQRPPLVPLFVIGFLGMILVRTTGVLSDSVLSAAASVEKVVLTAALVALGLGVRIARMRRLGGRPLLVGLLAWFLVAGTSAVAAALV